MNAFTRYTYIMRRDGFDTASQYFERCAESMDEDILANIKTRYPTAPDGFILQEYCFLHKGKFKEDFLV